MRRWKDTFSAIVLPAFVDQVGEQFRTSQSSHSFRAGPNICDLGRWSCCLVGVALWLKVHKAGCVQPLVTSAVSPSPAQQPYPLLYPHASAEREFLQLVLSFTKKKIERDLRRLTHHKCFLVFYWSVIALPCWVSFYVQQNESFIHVSPFFGFLAHLGHHRTLSRVPCAKQQVLTICFVCTYP